MSRSLPFRTDKGPLVKICGARRLVDLVAIRAAGADLAGIVFAPSKRRVDLATAHEIVADFQGTLPVAGVFVNAPLEEVNRHVDLVPLQFVQLSGQEVPDYVREVGAPVIKTVHLREGDSATAVLEQIDHYADACAFILDAWSPLGGGSGRQADWQVAAQVIAGSQRPILLAGGLTPETVMQALATTSAWGVDVSSGVERDGWKDPMKVHDFVRAARNSRK